MSRDTSSKKDMGACGNIPADITSMSSNICMLGWCGDTTPGMAYAIIRESTLKNASCLGRMDNPEEANLERMAIVGAFLTAGLSREQAWNRYRQSRHKVIWETSGCNYLTSLDESWDVPCTIVLFLAYW